VHAKFKLFTGELGPDRTLGRIAQEMENFVREKKCAPKSIGVEFLEHSGKVIVSLGYRDDESPYAVKFHSVNIGTASSLTPPDLSKLEAQMSAEAGKLSNVICHELLVTDKDEFVMVFMTNA